MKLNKKKRGVLPSLTGAGRRVFLPCFQPTEAGALVGASVAAPVAAGQVVGRVTVRVDGRDVAAIPVVACDAVEATGLGPGLRRIWQRWLAVG